MVAASLVTEDNEPISLKVVFGEATGSGRVPLVSYPNPEPNPPRILALALDLALALAPTLPLALALAAYP